MRKQVKGQGVIEYAGALVIASALVATVLAVGPEGMSDLFENILAAANDVFTSNLSEIS